jgi:hypothetical protein
MSGLAAGCTMNSEADSRTLALQAAPEATFSKYGYLDPAGDIYVFESIWVEARREFESSLRLFSFSGAELTRIRVENTPDALPLRAAGALLLAQPAVAGLNMLETQSTGEFPSQIADWLASRGGFDKFSPGRGVLRNPDHAVNLICATNGDLLLWDDQCTDIGAATVIEGAIESPVQSSSLIPFRHHAFPAELFVWEQRPAQYRFIYRIISAATGLIGPSPGDEEFGGGVRSASGFVAGPRFPRRPGSTTLWSLEREGDNWYADPAGLNVPEHLRLLARDSDGAWVFYDLARRGIGRVASAAARGGDFSMDRLVSVPNALALAFSDARRYFEVSATASGVLTLTNNDTTLVQSSY